MAIATRGTMQSPGRPPLELYERVARVEASLRPIVRIKGHEAGRMPLDERMRLYNVPGLSLAVINDYRADWTKGYGVSDADERQPVNGDTLFQAASVSKPVAALAALSLVERGLVALDEDINQRLGSWRLPDNEFTRDQKVTLRRLLCHGAGLTVHGFPGYERSAPLPTLPQILDGVAPANTAAVRVERVPGTMFQYSGGGTMIAQLMMTEVVAEPFPEFMRTTVFDALKMRDSTFEQPLPSVLHARAASGHDAEGRPLPGRWFVQPELAAAGLWTTSADMARFAIELQLAYGGRSQRVISQRYAREMLSAQIDEAHGLGPWLQGNEHRRFWHSGDNKGFKCKFIADLEGGRGAVVMTNADGATKLIDELLNSVAETYGWPSFLEERVAISLDRSVLDRYVGEYAVSPGNVIRVRRDGDNLLAAAPNVGEGELYAEAADVFFALEVPVKLVFEGDGDAAPRLTVRGDGFELLAHRI